MYKVFDKLYYPISVLIVLVVLLAVFNEISYLFFFPIVFIFLGMWRNHIWVDRLLHEGISVKAEVIKYRKVSKYDADVASSRRSYARKDLLVMEFVTEKGEVITGSPRAYDLKEPSQAELEVDKINEPLEEEQVDFDPTGKKYKVIYYPDKPTVFVFKNSLSREHHMLFLNILRILSVVMVVVLVYVLSKYSFIYTLQNLF
ncbi:MULTISPECIES: hypothetical protein [Myroides]|uniref:DUF3592 domain-containing protein n=1 Tax=Myroides albus TaxID=2562892 RepID=A0A6I3LNQ4_9FLAO|nr:MULTISPECIES: hypothetical protein [Myroides]MTG98950.1 hypothetical protein [Myroides albus]MVX35520.1 hypothetical protein [Myroides sp. LoEW2-1]UVD78582.1 hypothetical protein NWE55_10650 [Myroides albus]